VDALLLIVSTDRHALHDVQHYELPYVKPFARILGVIPISSEQRPRDMLKSLQTASQAIKDGHVVCIFAEGQITRIGQMLPFRRGMERIMKDVDAPIVPVALDGVWGSIYPRNIVSSGSCRGAFRFRSQSMQTAAADGSR
jgi:acyl-[acyl-carrier-protein]-phospholipid O-acyltransferase/long-chain-fatty-acid--[acyl-carrier-protein] ligase